MTEGFLAVLFVWALIDGDYGEAAVIALRWVIIAWRMWMTTELAGELQPVWKEWPTVEGELTAFRRPRRR